MRLHVLSTLACAALLTAELPAQSRPAFAGEWMLDTAGAAVSGGGRGDGRGRASGGGGRAGGGLGLGAPPSRLLVAQDDAALRIEERHDQGSAATLVYRLDGRASRNTMRTGRAGSAEATYTSRWSGDTLVTTIVRMLSTGRGETRLEYREARVLENDSTMVVDVSFVGRDGGRRSVYRRARND